MKPRHIIGIIVVALSMALTKLALEHFRMEEPARSSSGGGADFDALYPEAADAALKARAER